MIPFIDASSIFSYLFQKGSGLIPRSKGGKSSPTSRALHILEEKYARGEIEQQEFQEKKRGLLSRRSGRPAQSKAK
jgi:uncharacterized membrane protein